MSHSTQGEAARRTLTLPDAAWGPLAVGGMLGAVGLIGLAAGQPWPFPCLGPTAFLPGRGAGQAGVAVLQHGRRPPRRPARRGRGRDALRGELGAGGLLRQDARPLARRRGGPDDARPGAAEGLAPSAAATMLLVALGGIEPIWADAGNVMAGVAIVDVLGEGLRYLRREVVTPPRPGRPTEHNLLKYRRTFPRRR